MRVTTRASQIALSTVLALLFWGLPPLVADSATLWPNWSEVTDHNGALTGDCTDVLFIGVRGSGEPYKNEDGAFVDDGFGPKVKSVRDGLRASLDSSIKVRQVNIGYPAYPVESIWPDLKLAMDQAVFLGKIEQIPYLFSVDLGVYELREVIIDFANRCQGSKIILSGYSSGALVVHKALASLGDSSIFDSIILISDPARSTEAGQISSMNYGTAVGGEGIMSLFGSLVVDVGPSNVTGPIPPGLRQRTIEVCNEGDPVCNIDKLLPATMDFAQLIEEAIQHTASHGEYGTDAGGVVNQAALESYGGLIASRLNPSGYSSHPTDIALEVNTTTLNLSKNPSDMAVDRSGNIYLTTGSTNVVWKIPAGSMEPQLFAQLPNFEGRPSYAYYLAVDWAGNVYTHNTYANTVTKISPSGQQINAYAQTWNGNYAGDIAIARSGNVYTIVGGTGTILKTSSNGTVTSTFAQTDGIAVSIVADDWSGNLYLVSNTAPYGVSLSITKISSDGIVTPNLAKLSAPELPAQIAVDRLGNIYTVDYRNLEIARLTPDGVLTEGFAHVGTQPWGRPTAIGVDSSGTVITAQVAAPMTTLSRVTVGQPRAPAAPSELAATAGDGSAQVSWTAPADGGSTITGYTLVASPGGTSVSVDGTTTSAVVPGLTNGTAYTFTVTATNAAGTSPASAASTAVTPAVTPGAPTGVTAVPGSGSAVVSWAAPASDGGSAVTGYTVAASPGGKTATATGGTTATVTGLTNGTAYTFTVTATNAIGSSPDSAPSAAVTPGALSTLVGFTGTAPTRVLDTRVGIGAPTAQLGAGATLTLAIPDLPAGATAVALNVTVNNPTTGSYLTVYPGGSSRPNASNLNFTAWETIPNMVLVPVGPGGTVTFYNDSGSVDVIADLVGSFAPGTGGGFTGTAPTRVLDTRVGVGAPSVQLGAGATLTLAIPDLPAGATAVALNVTVNNPTTGSYLTVYPGGSSRPNASNLNFTAWETIPNMVLVPLGPGGTVTFYNDSGSVDVIADLVGSFAPGTGGGFTGTAPTRVLDTRVGIGAPSVQLGAGATLTLAIPDLPAGATAVALNVTVNNPTTASYLTVYPGGSSRPNASNLNFTAWETIPNMVLVPLGPGGTVSFYNDSGNVDVIADLVGYYS